MTFKSAHTFASVLDYHIFFLHIYDILAKLLQQAYLDRQVTAHTIDPGARSCIDAFDELLRGRKRKKILAADAGFSAALLPVVHMYHPRS